LAKSVDIDARRIVLAVQTPNIVFTRAVNHREPVGMFIEQFA
jgi:hypothetical protein